MVGIEIKWEYRDVTILVNGREAAYATYDLHGSAGVEAVADTARNIGNAFGVPVFEEKI